jgi:hypothetical protein
MWSRRLEAAVADAQAGRPAASEGDPLRTAQVDDWARWVIR